MQKHYWERPSKVKNLINYSLFKSNLKLKKKGAKSSLFYSVNSIYIIPPISGIPPGGIPPAGATSFAGNSDTMHSVVIIMPPIEPAA